MKLRRRASQVGLVLMGLMVFLALLGLTGVHFAESAMAARQRAMEDELLWVGMQYQRAFESYFLASPGKARHLPVNLEELVRDSRFPQPVRHIRRLYPDPLQPDVPWGILRKGNQIMGVYSQSDATPQRRTGFGPGLESLDGSMHYSDWRFLFFPRGPGGGPPASPPKATPTSAKP